MALFNTEKIDIARLHGETLSVALATNGNKTLHIVTGFYDIVDVSLTEPFTEYQLTFDGTLENFSDFGMAVERYNEL